MEQGKESLLGRGNSLIQQATVGASWVGTMILNIRKCQRCKQPCILDDRIQLEGSGVRGKQGGVLEIQQVKGKRLRRSGGGAWHRLARTSVVPAFTKVGADSH